MEPSEPEIIDTLITDHWGVDWTAMEIVRDFLQNFYDENPINNIDIKIESRTVTVSAPVEFDYKSLVYFGSDKGPDDIGQYGEGFKAALVNAMRNHNCTVKTQIKDVFLEFFFVTEKIGATEKKVVKCKKSKADPIKGTKLIIENCSKDILEEFKFGLNYFFYDSNPLFAKVLIRHYGSDIIVYKSISEESGYVFYKKLLRAKLDVPIVIVCNRKYKSIDDKIKHDRDRKAFNDDVLKSLLQYIFNLIDLSEIINILKPWWESGHRLLSMMSSGWRHKNYTFPENYYAKSGHHYRYNYDVQLQIEEIEREFKQKGYKQCPAYMANLGMKCALSVSSERVAKLREKTQKLYTRKTTQLENEALLILKSYISEIDPGLVRQFETANYVIGESDDLMGQLRLERAYRSRDVYLCKDFFLFNFAEALAVLMHEWSHIYGYDGSRGFTDALTQLISGIIEKRLKLDRVEEKWKMSVLKIAATQSSEKEISKVDNYLENLTEEQKIKILQGIPESELLKLIKKEDSNI